MLEIDEALLGPAKGHAEHRDVLPEGKACLDVIDMKLADEPRPAPPGRRSELAAHDGAGGARRYRRTLAADWPKRIFFSSSVRMPGVGLMGLPFS